MMLRVHDLHSEQSSNFRCLPEQYGYECSNHSRTGSGRRQERVI